MSAHEASHALTRGYVEQVIAQEADAANVKASDVIGPSRNSLAVVARRHAMRRILDDTKCSQSALARLWGCAASDVSDAIARLERDTGWRRRDDIYDYRTIARLNWAHGAERAAAIVAGLDPRTAEDVASWRRLGGAS